MKRPSLGLISTLNNQRNKQKLSRHARQSAQNEEALALIKAMIEQSTM